MRPRETTGNSFNLFAMLLVDRLAGPLFGQVGA